MNLFYRSLIKYARYKMQPSDYKATTIPESLKQIIDLPYYNDNDYNHLLDIYIPQDSKELLPTIVDIHGGAWIYGNKEVNKKFAFEFVNQGFGVVNINYTLMPQATLQQQVQEIFATLHYISKHGDKYHLDKNNIVLMGDSAGGHLAGLVYAIMHQEELRKIYQVEYPDVIIKGICMIHGVSDLTFLRDSKNMVYKQTSTMIQGSEEKPTEWYNKACLLDVIDNCPKVPVLLISSEKDMLHFQSVLTNRVLSNYGWSVYPLFWGNEQHLEHVFMVLHPEYNESQKSIKKIAEFVNGVCKN